ncbi:hypothetical protein I4641_08830 [Waterburya agarophytonicola K14]|uniref:Tetratricopeptide repeat protein n=2 Tax=Waterburya TaxID=2886915 RepID=A0A964BSL4_9CYAN|nr:hypothetical protein [Waterburya agarophytonicola KI4]
MGLVFFLGIYYRKSYKVDRLYHQGKELEKQGKIDFEDLNALKQALAIYRQCSKLVNNSKYLKAASQCQQKIDNRYRFRQLLVLADRYSQDGFFTKALIELIEAQQLWQTQALTAEILKCKSGIKQQKQYEHVLTQAHQKAIEGEFQGAIDLLKPAIDRFSRRDGEQLLIKLNQVIQSKNLYQLGLIAEAQGESKNAIAFYQQALELIPEFIDCQLRLAIIALQNNPQQAINWLEKIEDERAAYIRGFAYTKLANWQQANQEWRSIALPQIEAQRYLLKELVARDRLMAIYEIEQLVDRKELEVARTISYKFIDRYGVDLIISHNLENYIEPTLESQMWHSKDWQKITAQLEQIWLKQQDIKSLHNWAIATYYQAQIHPDKLIDLIVAWTTAIANLKLDPTLIDVPWMGNNNLDLRETYLNLRQILNNAINLIRDRDIEEYLNLRDIYLTDITALFLGKQNQLDSTVNQPLFILPSCYRSYKKHFAQLKLSNNIWGALYTDWGIAVAACYEGDIARAIQIKPHKNPSSALDRFGECFVLYHEGCHYLHNQYWRKAIEPLQKIKAAINSDFQWCHEIDRLCKIQREYIRDFNEHLEFSEFCYLLINSQAAKSYYIEYQAMKIGLEIDNRDISFQQGLNKLKKLQNADSTNTVASNIIKTLEVNLELEKINHLWQQSEYEIAVSIAKKSHHEKVKFAVAEICLEVVLHILQNENLTYETIQSIQKIVQWAYELCPHEPSLQPVYNHLQQIGIYP